MRPGPNLFGIILIAAEADFFRIILSAAGAEFFWNYFECSRAAEFSIDKEVVFFEAMEERVFSIFFWRVCRLRRH